MRRWQLVIDDTGSVEGNNAFIYCAKLRRSCKTRSSWLNCALRDDEALYWVSIGHYEAVAVDN